MSSGFSVHFSDSESEEYEEEETREFAVESTPPTKSNSPTQHAKSDDNSSSGSDDLPSIEVLAPTTPRETNETQNSEPPIPKDEVKQPLTAINQRRIPSSSRLHPSASSPSSPFSKTAMLRSKYMINTSSSLTKFHLNMDADYSYYSDDKEEEEEEDFMEFRLPIRSPPKFINPVHKTNTVNPPKAEIDIPKIEIPNSNVKKESTNLNSNSSQENDSKKTVNHVNVDQVSELIPPKAKDSSHHEHQKHDKNKKHHEKKDKHSDGESNDHTERKSHSKHQADGHHDRKSHSRHQADERKSRRPSHSHSRRKMERSTSTPILSMLAQDQKSDSILNNELENPAFYVYDNDIDPNTSYPLAAPPPPQYETARSSSSFTPTSVRSYDGTNINVHRHSSSHRSRRSNQHRASDVSVDNYTPRRSHRRSHSRRSSNASYQNNIHSHSQSSEEHSQILSSRSCYSDFSHRSVYSDSVIIRTFAVYRCHRTQPKFWGGAIQFELLCQNKQILSAKTKGFTRSQVIIAPGMDILKPDPQIIATINVKDSTANFDLIQGGEITQMISFVHQTDILPRQVVVNFNLPVPGLPRRLVNLKPKYNKEKGTWQVNFRGRFVIKSTKNMVLVDEDRKRMMIVRKISTDDLEVEISKPFQDLTIFFIAISTFICSF